MLFECSECVDWSRVPRVVTPAYLLPIVLFFIIWLLLSDASFAFWVVAPAIVWLLLLIPLVFRGNVFGKRIICFVDDGYLHCHLPINVGLAETDDLVGNLTGALILRLSLGSYFHESSMDFPNGQSLHVRPRYSFLGRIRAFDLQGETVWHRVELKSMILRRGERSRIVSNRAIQRLILKLFREAKKIGIKPPASS